VILTYKGTNHLVKKNVRMESDRLSHRYTLTLSPNNTYTVDIDGKQAETGSLYEDFDMLPPAEILDPEDKKPSDWVDEPEMDDPEDKKPAGYDDIPAKIPDPDAKKPEDWDDEEDGEWEVPQIDNPAYKGAWKAKKVKNPAYKGAWVQKKIANPEFKNDTALYNVCAPCGAVGFELWQVKAGTIFDDIIVTDDAAEAQAFYDATFAKKVSDPATRRGGQGRQSAWRAGTRGDSQQPPSHHHPFASATPPPYQSPTCRRPRRRRPLRRWRRRSARRRRRSARSARRRRRPRRRPRPTPRRRTTRTRMRTTRTSSKPPVLRWR
jgi:calreticulin